jgi:hypothetical protein
LLIIGVELNKKLRFQIPACIDGHENVGSMFYFAIFDEACNEFENTPLLKFSPSPSIQV